MKGGGSQRSTGQNNGGSMIEREKERVPRYSFIISFVQGPYQIVTWLTKKPPKTPIPNNTRLRYRELSIIFNFSLIISPAFYIEDGRPHAATVSKSFAILIRQVGPVPVPNPRRNAGNPSSSVFTGSLRAHSGLKPWYEKHQMLRRLLLLLLSKERIFSAPTRLPSGQCRQRFGAVSSSLSASSLACQRTSSGLFS
jgi:hypothetical protein